MTDEQLQLEIEAVPKRQAPLRKVIAHPNGHGGPHGGLRTYLILECGHALERPLTVIRVPRQAHCHHCLGAVPNHNELAVAESASKGELP